jgi:hypothetical protein
MDRGGLDREVLEVLDRLDEGADFESVDQLLTAVRGVYTADGKRSPI